MPSECQRRISRGQIAALAGVVGVLGVLLLFGTHFQQTIEPEQPWRLRYTALQVSLALENNAATWFASMLLLTAALAMALCFLLDRRDGSPRSRALSWGWLLMAALFAGLSLDEMGSLHERIRSVALFPATDGSSLVNVPGWVGVLAVPAALVCLFMIAFGWFRLRQVPEAFLSMSAGFLLFASIPAQEGLEVAHWLSGGRREVAALLLEEGSELAATLFVLVAATTYARHRLGASAITHAGGAALPRLDRLVMAEAALFAGMLAVAFALPRLMDMQDQRGIALNWFPSALAFVVALACIRLATAPQVAGARRAVWWWAAVLHLVLSVDHGSAHRFTQELLAGTPAVRALLDLGLAGAIAAVAARLVQLTPQRLPRAAFIAWAALLITPVWLDSGQPWLAFAAYALLLPLVARRTAQGEPQAQRADGAVALVRVVRALFQPRVRRAP